MRKLKLVSMVLCLVLFSATVALAAGDDHPLPWKNFFFRIVNLILFAGVIVYFFGSKIKSSFINRTSTIVSGISSLEQRKADAQERLAEVEQRIASLDTERESILASYHQQGEALKSEIIAKAEKAGQQLIEQAHSTAQNEITQAIETIRAQLADEIVKATEKAIMAKVTPAEQAKLVDKYLTRVVLN